ncbi:MAG: LysR family transcriptional regulator [Desulfovibrionaceae bacterium]|nr:LysR family transcriptional regulator [Desulfovibrionaceae bacterium]
MLNPAIKTFVAAADSGSFSRAAEQLYVSKVSVMNQINALEMRIGVVLFERTNHGVFLTEAGASFYKNVKKLLCLSESAVHEAREIGGVKTRNIRVGASMMRPCNALVELWERMSGGSQDYQFSIVSFTDGRDGLQRMLKALGDAIDCFATPCGSSRLLEEYGFLPFSSCKCAVAMSRKHPLAQKKILSWEDIENESMLLVRRGESYVLDELRDDILREHPSIRIVDFDGYYDISAFNLCERRGYLMETLGIWKELHPSLVTIPVKWKYEMPYGIIYSKNPSETVRAFIEAAGKCMASKGSQGGEG